MLRSFPCGVAASEVLTDCGGVLLLVVVTLRLQVHKIRVVHQARLHMGWRRRMMLHQQIREWLPQVMMVVVRVMRACSGGRRRRWWWRRLVGKHVAHSTAVLQFRAQVMRSLR